MNEFIDLFSEHPDPSIKVPVVCAVLFFLIFLHCAGQIPPGGGPIDTTPPTIVATRPDTNSVRVQTNSIEIEISEYVDRRSVEESIFISPFVGDLEFDWSGTEVSVTFSGPLRKNTTYVVNVGTDVKDLRAQNRMAAGFTLAFSTGDSIDQGFISGRVFDESPEGVMIFAYSLQGIHPDTLNPGQAKPDYIMQTGKQGLFALANIAFGTYRVFAVRDQYRNLLYDKQIDNYGVAPGDITIDAANPGVHDVWFKLSQEDTTKPFVTKAEALNSRLVQVRFSEPLDSLTMQRAEFQIADTLTDTQVGVALQYLSRTTPSLTVVITDSDLDSNVVYRLRVREVTDRAGNAIDSVHNRYEFTGTNVPDTLKATMTVHALKDSARGVSLDGHIEIQFSEPVRQAALRRGIRLVRIAHTSTTTDVHSDIQWLNPTDVAIIPRIPLEAKTWYQIEVVMDSVSDLNGNRYADSTFVLRFETLDLRTTGTVEGIVVDRKGGATGGNIYVTAKSIDRGTAYEKTVRLQKPGKFTMEQIVEGRYTMNAFRDSDNSGSYSFGLPYPFVSSERFAVYADTLKVRARWGVEGVVVEIK